MLKIKNLTEDQMFAAALAYEASGCDIAVEEFLQKAISRYEEINTIRKKAPGSVALVGKKKNSFNRLAGTAAGSSWHPLRCLGHPAL